MYIYNVTVKVTDEIEQAWLQWMKDIHMKEVIETGMFKSYDIFQLLEPADDEGKTYVAQYFTDSLDDYNLYINQYAPLLREKGFEKFGNQFIAFRSLLRKI